MARQLSDFGVGASPMYKFVWELPFIIGFGVGVSPMYKFVLELPCTHHWLGKKTYAYVLCTSVDYILEVYTMSFEV